MAANMVMLGFLQEKSRAVSKESLVAAIKDSVKEKYAAMNIAALEEGIRLAQEDIGA